MAENAVNQDFADAGKYYYNVGVLMVLQIFIGLVGFGFAMLGYIGTAISFIGLIVNILAVNRLRSAAKQISIPALSEASSKLMAAIVLSIIGTLISQIVNYLNPYNPMYAIEFYQTNGYMPEGFMVYSAITLLGGLFSYIGIIIEYVGYKRLASFFTENYQMFPGSIGHDAAEGASKLKTASLMMILIFLIITALIGLIYYLIGYFGLGGTLKRLEVTPMDNIQQYGSQEPKFDQLHPSTPGQSPKFCRKCGSKLTSGQAFCPNCGAKVY
ncbi:MAG: zinc-ribbon domain-containing protein [Candidatus Lokiarchaeota archaeon]|nr:zinc-ribbon domain-containing protein [Candidatus Lokiarchaeota archaeon]